MKRIFVAVDISEAARRAAAAHIELLRSEFRQVRVSWDKPEKLHLTLKFLGDCESKQLIELENIVARLAVEITNFKLQITATGVFPNARNPRVLWIDVSDEAGTLSKINKELEAECERIGVAGEKRAFVPHLTIGRVREPDRAKDLARAHLDRGFAPVGFEVSEIVIYESKLLSTGSVYRIVSKQILKKVSHE